MDARSDNRIRSNRVRGALSLAALVLCGLGSGCTAITNPLADATPVRLVPQELLCPPRGKEVPLPLTLLRQPKSAVYRVGPGDTLGVYIEGFLGDRNQPLPVYPGDRVERVGERRLPPATGFPIPVQEDGTISLPVIDPLQVAGLTLAETRDAIRRVYVKQKLLNEKTDRIFVSLLTPRQSTVMVFREETSISTQLSIVGLDLNKRGSGFIVDLPAYENDVLHALARTGGLPGLDAWDAVVIYRDCFRDGQDGNMMLEQWHKGGAPAALKTHVGRSETIRIPLRTPPGKIPPIAPQDIVLQTGDVVYLEGRTDQVFFTGGLLPPGVFPLPRDFDLDVVTAVSYVRGPLYNGAFGGSNLSGTLIQAGLGYPSPRLLTVLRPTPNGGQMAIAVDLRKALKDPAERISVQAGDVLVLQEMPGDAVARYVSTTFLNFEVFWQVFHSRYATGVADIAAPDRITGQRIGQINVLQNQQ